jgi:hypothetical protein
MSQLKIFESIALEDLHLKDKLFICSNTSWDEYETILQQKADS